MRKEVNWLSEVALFLAGGLLAAASVRRPRGPLDRTVARERADIAPEVSDVRSALAKLERRLAEEASISASRFAAVEARLDQHSAKLAEMPAIVQIVSAVEDTLTKAMGPIHERLSGQEQAMTALKLAVGRNDRLIDRVLDLAKEVSQENAPSQSGL